MRRDIPARVCASRHPAIDSSCRVLLLQLCHRLTVWSEVSRGRMRKDIPARVCASWHSAIVFVPPGSKEGMLRCLRRPRLPTLACQQVCVFADSLAGLPGRQGEIK